MKLVHSEADRVRLHKKNDSAYMLPNKHNHFFNILLTYFNTILEYNGLFKILALSITFF